MQRARARAVLRYMHDKYKSTRKPSSFKCDSTNKQVLDRSGAGYLTQYVPALRDTVHSQIPTQYIVQCRLPSCCCLCWPHHRPLCRIVRMDEARCDGPHRHTHTHTHTHTAHTHTRITHTHTHSTLTPLVLPVIHSTHNSFSTLEHVRSPWLRLT